MPLKRLSEFKDYNKDDLLKIVEKEAGEDLSESLMVVAERITEIPESSCTINVREGEDVSDFIKKWTLQFLTGYKNRSSIRVCNPIGTHHDPLLDEIISARIENIVEDLEVIKYSHRLSMSAENIAGSLLEEYISSELIKYNWHCCWGETMKSIDFCNKDGQLLQIKNSDNSENSSSKTVRDGTKIKHWSRRKSRTGETNWNALNQLVGITEDAHKLTEVSFREFVRKSVAKNPGAIFLEEKSPWYGRDKKDIST